MPKFEEIRENWGEEEDYYYNWYYYEPRDVEEIQIEITKGLNDKFQVKLTGIIEYPINSSSDMDTKLTFVFESTLNKELKGYWVS